MQKINELFGKYPVTATVSAYFTATFAGTSSVAWMFNRPLEEALFIAAITAITGGVIGAVKVLDKDNESE